MRLIAIHPENLYLAWKDASKFIERGLEYTDNKYHLEDIYNLISKELMILWIVYNDEKQCAVGVVLTQVIEYPQRRSFQIFLLSGNNFEEMLTLLDELKEHAINADCKSIEFYGRPGWERILNGLEFEKIHTIMRLKL